MTFTATVTASSPGSGTPTGSVEFHDGSTDLGTGSLDATGKATFASSSLSTGNHSITATYLGDPNFLTGTSTALTQKVNQASTTTALGSSANPSTSGDPVTFTATISVTSPGSGTPTGTVTFYDGVETLGIGDVSGNIATFRTSTLSVGTHTIKAVYGGDTNFKASTSSLLSQVVKKALSPQFASSVPTGNAATFSAGGPVDQAIGVIEDGASSNLMLHDLALGQVSGLSPRSSRKSHA